MKKYSDYPLQCQKDYKKRTVIVQKAVREPEKRS